MEVVTWMVIVPFCFAALITGIVQGLGTPVGLVPAPMGCREAVLTVVARVLLLVHAQGVGQVAAVAADQVLSSADLRSLRIRLIADAGAALMALVVATTLSVYKPWGITSYGRQDVAVDSARDQSANRLWTALWFTALLAALTLFALMHVFGGMHHH